MPKPYFHLEPIQDLPGRLEGKLHLIQILIGPRQVGKTTAIQHFLKQWPHPSIYETADLLSPPDVYWIEDHWKRGREIAKKDPHAILVLDEVQKIPRWSEAVKRFHDEDVVSRSSLRVVLLGSSALMMQRGLKESLAGRFELIPFSHWTLNECNKAFGLDYEQYIFFGSYPGGLNLLKESNWDEDRWQKYIRDALVETVIGKDILLLTPVDKPALFRQVFQLACRYASEILAYTKMLGQLQDAGNTTTIASYLQLMESAGFLVPLPRYSGSMIKQRASSPKLILLNNALPNAVMGRYFASTRRDTFLWGRLVENAVGAHLFNHLSKRGMPLYYWRERREEIDFVVVKEDKVIGIEVKSGRTKESHAGLRTFLKKYPKAKGIQVGEGEADWNCERFLTSDPYELLGL